MTHPTAKHAILPAFLLALFVPQLAQAQSAGPLSGLYACEALTTPEAQLSCFLAETAKLRAGESRDGALSRPAAPAAPRAPAAASAEPDEFAPLAKDKPEAPKSRTMAIRSTTLNAKGYVRFTLENGEVWQQIEAARVKLSDDEVNELTLKRRSLGSFLGRVNGKRPSFRVRRIA